MTRNLRYQIVAVTVSLCLWITSSVSSAQTVDAPNPPSEPRSQLTSATDVSSGGALATGLVVALPAARGPVPNIGLSYSSDSANGLAGVGWHLSGFPAIVRAHDTGRMFDASDKFVFLPGGWGTPEDRDNHLVNASGNYFRKRVYAGAPPERFRPSEQSCGSGPCYWEMRDGSGTKYYFGGDANANAGLNAPGTWHATLWEPNNGVTQNRGIVAWPLYKVVDPDGNYLVVSYNQVADTFYPLRVEYNLPLVGTQGRAMSVHFQYENRPDRTPMPSYYLVRIKNIRVYGQSTPPSAGTLIRRYELRYVTSAASGRSLLASYREFGSNGNDAQPATLEATTFGYTPGSQSLSAHGVQSNVSGDWVAKDHVAGCQPGSDVSRCLWQSFTGDLNGDGMADFVRTYYGTYGGRVSYRCGGASGLSDVVTHSDYFSVQPAYLTAMGDFNGDGRQDLVAIHPNAGTLTTYIAYGGHANNMCWLGGWILQPSQTVDNVTMSSSPADWRILTADIDGDGMSDVVLFDTANNTLYWKMYRSGQLSATASGRYRSGVEWTSCNADYPYPATVGFNGIDVNDYNGDSKADIVASWSRRDISGTRFPGMISMLTVLGASSGLGPPSETCHTPNTSYPTPAVRFPYTAMRQGDINGDGRGDSILTYQGQAIRVDPPSLCDRTMCSGAIHGRDIRIRLGTTLAGGSSVQVYATDPASYPYASLYARPAHLNQWEFITADFNGDSIDDYVQSYRGRMGDRLYEALGNRTGLGPLMTRVAGTGGVDGAQLDYPKSTIASGDFNGDGLADLARVLFRWTPPEQQGLAFEVCNPSPCLGANSTSVSIHYGTPSGLKATGPAWTVNGGIIGGSSHSLRALAADFNGDGRDDILFVNDNAEPDRRNLVANVTSRDHPPKSPGSAPNKQGGFFLLLSSQATNGGLPDLLASIDNGVLGKTEVTYRLAREYPNAVKADWPDQCLGWDGAQRKVTYINGTICGRIDGRPRALVWHIVRDHGVPRNGVTFKERMQYDYTNRRVYGGASNERADLGFSLVVSTNLDTGANTWSWYRQDKPFEGMLDTATFSAGGSVAHRQSYGYFQDTPVRGVTAIKMSDSLSCLFEGGVALPCRHAEMSYDPMSLLPVESRDGTNDIPAEKDIITQFAYSADMADWLFRPMSTWTVRANSAGTLIVLDMRRITYDSGKPAHVLKRERILFDDAETASCTFIGDPWDSHTCAEKLVSGAAHWVTTFTTNSSSYDAQGNLTWFGSYPVSRDAPNPAWLHPVTLSYDATYQGLIASTTNALHQTTSYTYDAAGRLLTTTDPNNQTTTFGYDVYGRPMTYAPPGVGLYQKRWSYAGVDPVRGYQVQEFTYSSPTGSHQASAFFDGFGGLAQTRDHTGTSSNAIETLHQDVWVSSERVRRESWPYYIGSAIVKFIETTIDARGRPVRIERVKNDASFTTDNTASGKPAVDTFAYLRSNDGRQRITAYTDTNGATRNVYTDYRGLVTQVTDAAGTMTFSYSTALRLAQVTLPSTTMAFRNVYYTYDSWGRLKTENDPNGEGIIAYTYDDASLLTRKTYYTSPAMTTRTRELWYSYDQLDRLQHERALSSPFSDLVTYTYDETSQQNGIGRLTTVIDTTGMTQFNYDGRGNLTSKVITLNGLNGSVTYSYAYDDSDRVTGMGFPDAVQKFTYTVDSVLTGVTHNGVGWGSWTDFDVFKRAQTFQAYDNAGWTNTTRYGFDVDQRMSRIVQRQKNGSVIQDLSYAYDAVGNVKTITDNRPTKTINGINTDLTQSFAYDALNQLCATWSSALATGTCSTTSPAPTATLTYDGIGNLLTDSGTTNTYTTMGSERVIENRRPLIPEVSPLFTPGTVAGQTILNWRAYHDSEGNRTRFEDCSVSPCVNYYYGYDYRGRLTSVTQDGVVHERYEYDFTNWRTKKSYNNLNNTAHAWFFGPSYTVRKNSVDMSRAAQTLSIAGIANHTYGDKIVGQASASTVDSKINQPFTGNMDQAVPLGIYLRQPDLLGSQTVMTRASDGAVVSRNRYDVWGNHLAANSLGQDTTYEKFTGQPREDYSGLAYYGFRYYDPKTRRFITPDDRIADGGAQSFNRLAYVRNNPASYIDPTGHQETGPTTSKHCYPPPCGGGTNTPGGGGGATPLYQQWGEWSDGTDYEINFNLDFSWPPPWSPQSQAKAFAFAARELSRGRIGENSPKISALGYSQSVTFKGRPVFIGLSDPGYAELQRREFLSKPGNRLFVDLSLLALTEIGGRLLFFRSLSASEIHKAAGGIPRFQNYNPTAVLHTAEGPTFVTRGPTQGLTRAQLELIHQAGYEAVLMRPDRLVPRAIRIHPDIRVIVHARLRGLTPQRLEVVGQPFCPYCRETIRAFGGEIVAPGTAVFPGP